MKTTKTELFGAVVAWLVGLAITGLLVMWIWNVIGIMAPITFLQGVGLRLLFSVLKDGFKLELTFAELKK